MYFHIVALFSIIFTLLMHFHNIGNDNQEDFEGDFQRDLSTEFGEGPEAEAANISLVEQGKHRFALSLIAKFLFMLQC